MSGTHQSIAQKLNNNGSSVFSNSVNNGPGAYDINHVRNLRKNPNATMGRQKRKSLLCNAPKGPGPEKYRGHRKSFNENYPRSNERNAPKFSIGNDGKENIRHNPTPGPLDYNATI